MRKIKYQKNHPEKHYLTKRSDCKGCPLASKCIGKSHEKRIRITLYKEYYDRALKRANSRKAKYYKTVRQSTVEPVFGTLINFMGMRKINTRGIDNANKVMLMAAIAYNLKKMINHQSRLKSDVIRLSIIINNLFYRLLQSVVNDFLTVLQVLLQNRKQTAIFLSLEI